MGRKEDERRNASIGVVHQRCGSGTNVLYSAELEVSQWTTLPRLREVTFPLTSRLLAIVGVEQDLLIKGSRLNKHWGLRGICHDPWTNLAVHRLKGKATESFAAVP